MISWGRALLISACVVLPGGCASGRSQELSMDHSRLRQRAMDCLKAGVGYSFNPVVRVEAVEALESALPSSAALPWVRSALHDDHPAVRFAACVAVGRLRDEASEPALSQLAKDVNDNVRVAALFALHRLGRTEQTGMMPEFLLNHDDPAVRRNAALVLGLMEEPGAVKVLARAMKDRDPGVRQHALEAMACLGTPQARQELGFMTNAGVGSDETFAIQALGATRRRAYMDVYRNKLTNGSHLETRLAAARALGLLDSDEGFELAYSTLRRYKPPPPPPPRAGWGGPDDPPEQRALRVRQLAVAALGAIGDERAQAALAKVMERADDPRMQVAAAKAILEILEAGRSKALPFTATAEERYR